MQQNLHRTESSATLCKRLTRTLCLALLMGAFSYAATQVSTNGKSAFWTPATSTAIAADTAQPRSVMPQGWRRTANGWERVSDWGLFPSENSLSLGQWIDRQRTDEPRWLQTSFQSVASIHPLVFAAGQCLAIFLVIRLCRDQTCHGCREE